MTDAQLVIDASVLAQIYVRDQDERFTSIADKIVRRHVNGELELVAPQFILYEIPSAIHRAVRRRRLDLGPAQVAVEHFFGLRVRTVGSGDDVQAMIESAFSRAAQLGCHVYDALYLIVAEVLDLPCVTADKRLYESTHREVPNLVWIEDYESST